MLPQGTFWGIFVVWLYLVLMACSSRHQVVDVQPKVQRMAVQISAIFGEIVSPDSGEIFQEATSAELEMVISLAPTRLFRDGSEGRRLGVERASLRLGADGVPFRGFSLAGRAVELRTFPDGEILIIDWVETMAGAGRFMDVFELIFPAISPAPPSLARGASAPRRIIWPYLGERKLRWDSAVDAVWTNEGAEERAGVKTWRLIYTGPWRIHGGRRTGPGRIQFRGLGKASGTVWLDKSSGDLSGHDFEWSRTVTVQGESGQLQQVQKFVGTVKVIQ